MAKCRVVLIIIIGKLMANGIEEILQMSQSCNLKKELIEELKKI